MSSRRTTLAALFLVLAVPATLATRAAAADDAARRAVTVAHVGPRVVTVAELEDRLARIPRFQLESFGTTATAVAAKFLDQVVVRDALFALGAEDRHLDQDPAVKHEIERTLAEASIRKLHEAIGIANAIPMDEVQAYYDANKSRYDAPERLNVWRILCATKAEAQTVLDAAKKDGTVQTFTALAREHSMDKATYLRGGNLGFAADDGVSNEPGVRIDPAVMSAAKLVKDGELVPAPLPEGTGFAVVWRRGTTAAQHQTVQQAATQIRDLLWHQKGEAAEKALIAKLRAEKVKDEDDSLLGSFDVAVMDGTIQPRKRPVTVPPR